MATISSLGVGSGLDIASIVEQLVASEAVPKETLLNAREAELQAELSAVGTFKAALSSFQDTFSSLSTATAFRQATAASSDSGVFTASASGEAIPGSYSIEVTDLAQAHKLASKAFTNTTDTVGTGDLTFRFGTYDSDLNTFTANPERTIESITIDGTNNSLEGIRDAINAADIGVSASIVNDGSGYRLMFKSDSTGADNSIEITVNDTGDGNHLNDSGLSQLAFDPTAAGVGTGKNLTQTSAAQDASFSIDGLLMTRSTNDVTGAIEGVNLTLKGETSGTPALLTVSAITSTASNNVQAFVNAYNELETSLDQLTGYNATTDQAGALLGDSLVNGALNGIRNLITGSITGLSGQYTSLAQLGISFQADGSLELDASTLNQALEDDPDAVARVFAAVGTPTDSLVDYVSSTSDTLVGDYAVEITQLATQGSFTGAAAGGFPLTVDATNDTFEIKVDGVQSGVISLTQATYGTGAELATQLQSRINADSELKAQGVTVTVEFDTDHFVITSDRYGSTSKVEFTAVEGSGLGLSVATGTDGVDVAGNIGGVAALGSGQQLTGTGDADGLKLEITGGALGSRGTVSFTRGMADLLDTFMETYLGDDNIIDSRTDGINTRIDSVEDDREDLALRIQQLEARYIAQFTALDLLLNQLQATSSYLTQQLANLPGAYDPSSS
jgi:flagellar hook-associated protein 2